MSDPLFPARGTDVEALKAQSAAAVIVRLFCTRLKAECVRVIQENASEDDREALLFLISDVFQRFGVKE